VVLIFIVSVVTFVLIHSAPGGPAILADPDLTAEEIQARVEGRGLDDPIPVQYVRWLGNVLRGDFGRSFSSVEPVTSLLADRFPNTLLLTGVGLVISVLVAIPLGVISALKRNSLIDRFVTGFAFVGISIPVFWLGILLILLFAVHWNIFPSGGMYTLGQDRTVLDVLKHMAMPVSVIVVANLAALVRYTRSGMISVLSEDYVRTARSKGLSFRAVTYGHALRNALIPVITMVAISIPNAVSGAAITETVFSWPGMGRLAVDAARTRDYPVVMGATLTVAVVVVLSNLLADLLYAYVDPRIRYD
jgi:peptide/nickel transport system permease protein